MLGAEYQLWFGAEYDWRARVSALVPGRLFELEVTVAMDDWVGTRIRAELEEVDGVTTLRFSHLGWPDASEHFRVSTFCWAMYLRVMRRHVEHGEVVAYEQRLDV